MKVKPAAMRALAATAVFGNVLSTARAAPIRQVPLMNDVDTFSSTQSAPPSGSLAPIGLPPVLVRPGKLPQLQLGKPGVVEVPARATNATVIERSFPLTPAGAGAFSFGFADYPVGEESFYELDDSQTTLPAPLKGDAHLIEGNNHSDDLFMYLARPLGPNEGVVPNGIYRVEMTVQFASNAPTSSWGVGGSPGSSVYMKGHVVNREPRAAKTGRAPFSVDKGNQAQMGTEAMSFGVYGKDGDSDDDSWQLQTRTARSVEDVKATDDGKLWLYFGSDSGFEATTKLYVKSVDVKLTPRG
jgi:hypothetical protein